MQTHHCHCWLILYAKAMIAKLLSQAIACYQLRLCLQYSLNALVIIINSTYGADALVVVSIKSFSTVYALPQSSS